MWLGRERAAGRGRAEPLPPPHTRTWGHLPRISNDVAVSSSESSASSRSDGYRFADLAHQRMMASDLVVEEASQQ